MAKHLVRRVVRTPADLTVLTEYLTKRIWGIRADSADRFRVTTSNMGIQAVLPAAVVKVSETEETVERRVSVADESGLLNRTYDDATLMEEFYPLRFGLFEPFEKPVTLARIRDILGTATNVQGLTPIDRDSFEVIRSEGLAPEP